MIFIITIQDKTLYGEPDVALAVAKTVSFVLRAPTGAYQPIAVQTDAADKRMRFFVGCKRTRLIDVAGERLIAPFAFRQIPDQ